MINQPSTSSHRKLLGCGVAPSAPRCWEAPGCPALLAESTCSRRPSLEGYSFAKTALLRAVQVGTAALPCRGKSCISASSVCRGKPIPERKGGITTACHPGGEVPAERSQVSTVRI